MICTIRIPDVLQAMIDQAADKGERSNWILEACRMRLDSGDSSKVEQRPSSPQVEGSIPSPRSNIQDLRDICAGKVAGVGVHERMEQVPTTTVSAEIPICGIEWWEESEHWRCLMDKGHKSFKHGMHGMVLNITN